MNELSPEQIESDREEVGADKAWLKETEWGVALHFSKVINGEHYEHCNLLGRGLRWSVRQAKSAFKKVS